MVNSFRCSAALRVAPKARADLVDGEGLLPDAGEAAHERVEVGRQHRPQAAVAVEPEDLLAQLAAGLDAHLAQGVAADDGRRHDLDQTGVGERRAQRLLETAQRGHARAGAQRFERRPARRRELEFRAAGRPRRASPRRRTSARRPPASAPSSRRRWRWVAVKPVVGAGSGTIPPAVRVGSVDGIGMRGGDLRRAPGSARSRPRTARASRST